MILAEERVRMVEETTTNPEATLRDYKSHRLVVNARQTSQFDVWVGRSSSLPRQGEGKWGPEFVIGAFKEDGSTWSRSQVLRAHLEKLKSNKRLVELIKRELRGKRLACNCSPLPCHADLLAEIANEETLDDELKEKGAAKLYLTEDRKETEVNSTLSESDLRKLEKLKNIELPLVSREEKKKKMWGDDSSEDEGPDLEAMRAKGANMIRDLKGLAAAQKAESGNRRPKAPFVIAMKDSEGEYISTDERDSKTFKEIVDRVRGKLQRKKIKRGQFFLACTLKTRPSTLLIGERAAAVMGLMTRDYWQMHPGRWLGGGLLYEIDADKVKWMSGALKSRRGLILQEVLDVLVNSDPESSETANALMNIRAVGSLHSAPLDWKQGECLSYSYANQYRYCQSFSAAQLCVTSLIGRCGGIWDDEATIIRDRVKANFEGQRRLPDAEVTNTIKSVLSHAAGRGDPSNRGFFIDKAVLATQFRDLMTVMSETGSDFMLEADLVASGIAPITKANEGGGRPRTDEEKSTFDEILGDLKEKSLGDLLYKLISCLLRKKNAEEYIGKDKSIILADQLEWAKLLENQIELRCQEASGGTPLNTRGEGGQNGLLGRILEAAVKSGKIVNPLVFGRKEIMEELRGKSFERATEVLEGYKIEMDRFLLKIAQSRDKDEKDVYLEMLVKSPDGKVRYTTIGERMWGLFSIISWVRKHLLSYSTLRGKGSTDLGRSWEETLNGVVEDFYNVVLEVETDLTDATYLLRKQIIISLLQVVRDSFPGLDELFFAGWDRQTGESDMIRRRENKKKPALSSYEVLETREEYKDPDGYFAGSRFLKRAEEILEDFMKEIGEDNRVPTMKKVGEAFSLGDKHFTILKAAAGGGKTVSGILLGFIIACLRKEEEGVADEGAPRQREDEVLRWIVTSRNSLDSLFKTLMGKYPERTDMKKEVGDYEESEDEESDAEGSDGDESQPDEDDLDLATAPEPDSLIGKLTEFLREEMELGADVKIGFRHRYIKKGDRNGSVVISTPATWLMERKFDRRIGNGTLTAVDEFGNNLSCAHWCMSLGIAWIGVTATPPDGVITPNTRLVEIPFVGRAATTKGSIADVVSMLSGCAIENGTYIAFMLNSEAKILEMAREFSGALGGDEISGLGEFFGGQIGGMDIRLVATFAPHEENARMMSLLPRNWEREDDNDGEDSIEIKCPNIDAQVFIPPGEPELRRFMERRKTEDFENFCEGSVIKMTRNGLRVLPREGLKFAEFGVTWFPEEDIFEVFRFRKEIFVGFFSTLISRSDGPVDLIISSESERRTLTGACGQERVAFFPYDEKARIQIAARACRRGRPTVMDGSGRPVTAIFFDSGEPMLPASRYYDGCNPFVGGMELKQCGLPLNAHLWRWTRSQAVLCRAGYEYGRERNYGLLSSKCHAVALMMEGINKIPRRELISSGTTRWLRETYEVGPVLANTLKRVRGEEMEEMKRIILEEIDISHEDSEEEMAVKINRYWGPLRKDDIEDLARVFPDRVAIVGEGEEGKAGTAFNKWGVEDPTVQVEAPGTYFLLTGKGTQTWYPIDNQPIEEMDEVKFQVDEEIRVIKRAKGDVWVLEKTKGFSEQNARLWFDALTDSPVRNWATPKGLDEFERVTTLSKDAGWVLTVINSAGLLELSQLLTFSLVHLFIRNPVVMERIFKLSQGRSKEGLIRDGVDTRFLVTFLEVVQWFPGGQLNVKKTYSAFLRLRRTCKGRAVPIDEITGRVFMDREGDDAVLMLLLHLPEKYFPCVQEYHSGMGAASFAKRLLVFELEGNKMSAHVQLKEIPRLTRAMAGLNEALPMCCKDDGDQFVFPVTIKNNLVPEIMIYREEILEYLERTKLNIDCSEIYNYFDAIPSEKRLKKMKRAKYTVLDIQKASIRPLDLMRPMREAAVRELSECFEEKEVNAKVHAAWSVHARHVLGLHYLMAEPRQSESALPWSEVVLGIESGVLPKANRPLSYKVPKKFCSLYIASKVAQGKGGFHLKVEPLLYRVEELEKLEARMHPERKEEIRQGIFDRSMVSRVEEITL